MQISLRSTVYNKELSSHLSIHKIHHNLPLMQDYNTGNWLSPLGYIWGNMVHVLLYPTSIFQLFFLTGNSHTLRLILHLRASCCHGNHLWRGQGRGNKDICPLTIGARTQKSLSFVLFNNTPLVSVRTFGVMYDILFYACISPYLPSSHTENGMSVWWWSV